MIGDRFASIVAGAMGVAVATVWVLRGIAWYVEHNVKPKGAAR